MPQTRLWGYAVVESLSSEKTYQHVSVTTAVIGVFAAFMIHRSNPEESRCGGERCTSQNDLACLEYHQHRPVPKKRQMEKNSNCNRRDEIKKTAVLHVFIDPKVLQTTHLREVLDENTHHPLQDVADAWQPFHAGVGQDGVFLVSRGGCCDRCHIFLGNTVVNQHPTQRLSKATGIAEMGKEKKRQETCRQRLKKSKKISHASAK